MKLNSNRGVMLIASAMMIVVLAGASTIFLTRSLNEAKFVAMEYDRLKAYSAAEAAFQGSLNQIGTNNYTGYVNTNNYGPVTLNISGQQSSVAFASKSSESEDFIIVNATGSGAFTNRSLEARVFLDSNLSKYLVYANTPSFGSGTNAQYGEPLTDPDTGAVIVDDDGRERVAEDDFERAMMYFTGDWIVSGDNVQMYGDVYVEDDLQVNSSKDGDVHGDTYVADQYYESGTLTVDDTYDDDSDRHNANLSDIQDSLMEIDLNFYQTNNCIPSYGSTSQSRYLVFSVSADDTHTVVTEYNDVNLSNVVATHDLPSTAILYINGDAWVRGTIKGRVSIVSSDDIMIQGDLEYANGLDHADSSDAAAYIARDKLFLMDNNLNACGIFYARNVSGSTPAFDARYNNMGAYDPNAKQTLRLRGNRIINGSTNLSYYPDRAYIYDPYLKKFRPPGLPITSVVSFVRET